MAVSLYLSGGGTPATALGGAKTAVLAPKRLFGPISAAEYAAGGFRYLCAYVQPDADLDALKVCVERDTPAAGTTIAVGWGTAGIGGVEPTIADNTTAPVGVTFASPATLAAAVAGGDMTIGESRPVWIRLAITPTAALGSEKFTLKADGTPVSGLMEIDGVLVEVQGLLVELS